jgi:DNA-binding MarR family transcriptional regulator
MKASSASALERAGEIAEVDLTALQQLVGFQLRMVDLAMYQNFFERFPDRAFTPAMFSTLASIRQNPGVRHGALADALRIQRPNMTAMLNELESMGYVSRRASAADRRSVALHLTERGERATAKMLVAMQTFDRDMTAGLSTQERKTLLGLLAKVAAAASGS